MAFVVIGESSINADFVRYVDVEYRVDDPTMDRDCWVVAYVFSGGSTIEHYHDSETGAFAEFLEFNRIAGASIAKLEVAADAIGEVVNGHGG